MRGKGGEHMRRIVTAFAVIGLTLVVAERAQAAALTYGYDCITGDSSTDCDILEAQVLTDVDFANNLVSFRFYNTGPDASSITDVYFRDTDDKLSFDSMLEGSGTEFDEDGGCSPIDPPASNGFTLGFCTDADPPVASNGINPGEELTLFFALNGVFTFQDVLDELADGTLKTAVKVQAFESGGSEAGIGSPGGPGTGGPGGAAPIPEPTSLLLMGSGLTAAAMRLRRKKN
jgi:PEP-CTERM motif